MEPPMNRKEIYQAMVDFLSLTEGNGRDIEDRETDLRIAVDRLALVSHFHFKDFQFDKRDFPNAPREDHSHLRKRIESLYPNFGYYNTAADVTLKIGETELVVGDAIDDIADIAADMHEVLWRWRNTSADDALWHFRLDYESHWGSHLRHLQLYLLSVFLGS
jgi:hypothetical protein